MDDPTEQSNDRIDEIIQKAVSLDSDAFGELYREFAPRIHRFVSYRVRNHDLADDITNQVFMKSLKAIGKYDHRSVPEFNAWLFRIARNTISDHWRRSRPSVSLETLNGSFELVDDNDELDRIANREQLSKAMKQLTPDQAEVLSMRFGLSMTHREIANILNKQEPAVRALQFRALTTLRAILGEGDTPA